MANWNIFFFAEKYLKKPSLPWPLL